MSDNALDTLRAENKRQREEFDARVRRMEDELAARKEPDPNDPRNWNPAQTIRDGYAEPQEGGEDE